MKQSLAEDPVISRLVESFKRYEPEKIIEDDANLALSHAEKVLEVVEKFLRDHTKVLEG